jgi:hypothetical protein
MRGRQAQLRAEFADWYPGIEPEKWHSAAWVREMVLAQHRHGSPRWAIEGRILDDEHFRFEGVSLEGQRHHEQRLSPPEVTPPPGFS